MTSWEFAGIPATRIILSYSSGTWWSRVKLKEGGNMRRIIAAVVALTLVTLVVRFSSAQDAPAGKTIQLFNGKDLDNWEWVGKDKDSKIDQVFSVKDGVIYDIGKPAGYIRTKDKYTSYVLKVQWRFIKKGNSGVLLRTQEPDKVWPKGVEAQLNSGDA